MRKRMFDVVVISLAAVVWVPVVTVSAAAVLILSGRPIFYRSRRWVGPRVAIEMVKLRVMIPNASEFPEPIEAGRFLSTPTDSPLYTGIGRFLDRLGLNEIPQFVHVLRGEMSIVGPRPLTDSVRTALQDEHPDLDHRWHTSPAGLTGLPQLVGRMSLTDQQRLDLEEAYADAVRDHYSLTKDFAILLYTVLITFGLKKPLTFDRAIELTQPPRARATNVRVTRFGPAAHGPAADADAVA